MKGTKDSFTACELERLYRALAAVYKENTSIHISVSDLTTSQS